LSECAPFQRTNFWILNTIMASRPTVLVVDDESELRQLVAESLEARGFSVAQAGDAADALSRLEGFAYDGLVLDLALPDGNGMDLLYAALERYPDIRTFIVTGSGGVPEAVAAIRRGAIDFLTKPFSLTDLATRLWNAINSREAETDAALEANGSAFHFENVVGAGPAMRHVLQRLELVSAMNSTVLLVGETGTGKELIARTIHENSPRRDYPFIGFNAAALPEGLVEAELFGHVKGAFTGAINARVGRFETAHRGTLFIDEVASMPVPVQAKLLRALQEREVERVGDSKPVKFDVRVIAATNRDLRKMVREGSFREDLFYRLNVVPIPLPPLRTRREDIPTLAQHFVKKSCKHNGLPLRGLPQATVRALMAYDWPGNIRELENAIEHAVALSGRSSDIVPEMLPQDMTETRPTELMSPVTIPDVGLNFTSVVSQLERELILRSLEKTGGNKRRAARLLNLSRTTLIDKLQRLEGAKDVQAD
jgi:DNA-binding NtrC family response regulator